MPPKVRVTREQIADAALSLVRERGIGALNARELATRLGCSPQPIFTCFSGMEEVREQVMHLAYGRYFAMQKEDMEKGEFPPVKASGMSYIRFAGEEKQLFRFLFMRDRRGEEKPMDPPEELIAKISESTGMTRDEAILFHAELWIVVHGIGTMIATDYFKWEKETISMILSDVYFGLLHRYKERKATSDGGN